MSEIKTSWSKPQKINALGHRLTRPLQESYDVLVPEKVDEQSANIPADEEVIHVGEVS